MQDLNQLTLCSLSNFGCFLSSTDGFFKLTFFEKSRNTNRVRNSSIPDQARQNCSPDFGPDCLQRFSSRQQVSISREGVNNGILIPIIANQLSTDQTYSL